MTATAPQFNDLATLIVPDASSPGGRPVIRGTRTHIHALAAWHHFHGMTADEIADNYPHLPRSHVYAALAFYLLNSDRILGFFEEDRWAELAGREWERLRLAEGTP